MISKLSFPVAPNASGPLPGSLEAKEQAQAQRLQQLEDIFEKADQTLAQKLEQTNYQNGSEGLARLDQETEDDRSWHDFSDANLSWAIDTVYYNAPSDLRDVLSSRWKFQAEIDHARQDLYKTRAEIAALDKTPFIDGLVYDVLGTMFGLPRPKYSSTK